MEDEKENLEERIGRIEERNKNVEIDKTWETSRTRRILIALFTYAAIGLYLWVIRVPQPWIHAIVPTIGFMISTLAMPWCKRIWVRFMCDE